MLCEFLNAKTETPPRAALVDHRNRLQLYAKDTNGILLVRDLLPPLAASRIER